MYRNAQMYLNPRNKVMLTQFKLKAIFKTFTLEINVQLVMILSINYNELQWLARQAYIVNNLKWANLYIKRSK